MVCCSIIDFSIQFFWTKPLDSAPLNRHTYYKYMLYKMPIYFDLDTVEYLFL